MNSYKISNGDRIKKNQIDKNVRNAKKNKIEQQLNDYGYNFCEKCEIAAGVRLDCSHVISVDKCQKNGQSELAWDIKNIKILCRDCHKEHDGLGLKFSKSF